MVVAFSPVTASKHTFFKLSQICDVSHSTLKNSERRGGQLSVDTIERICDGLGITMSEFFARKG